MTKTPIYSFASTTNMIGTDYFVILNGLIPKLIAKSDFDTLYAPTSNPTFSGTVSVPIPPANSNDSTAASTSWVKSKLTTNNILAGGQPLDSLLANKVSLAGVLTGTIENPELTPTGVVPGTYEFASLVVGEDGRISSIISNTVSGGASIPEASTTTLGLVRVNENVTSPVVYTKDTVDVTFLNVGGNPKTVTARHNFSNGIGVGNSNIFISDSNPGNDGLWFQPDVNQLMYRKGSLSVHVSDNTVHEYYHEVDSVIDYFLPHSSNVQTNDFYFSNALALMFQYSGYDSENRYDYSLFSVSTSGSEIQILNITLVPGSTTWTLQYPLLGYSSVVTRGIGTRITKVGNPGLLSLASTIVYRQVHV